MEQAFTDKERLDFLQEQLEKERYTGRCICRWSTTGRGWRLHETSQLSGCRSVREAIDTFIKQEKVEIFVR